MQTKLSRYADGVIEAAWLAAVITIPIFFNVYSSRIFEPDKAALLRSLAIITLAAWAVKLFDQRGIQWTRIRPEGPRWKTLLRFPLAAPVLALAASYLISTLLSIVPGTSLFGSYQRMQGSYTMFSYLVFFASLLGNLRRKEQVERLLTAMILSSLPVAVYGLLQRFMLDPIPWGGDTVNRIASTMGNSIFTGAYLILVFPLTVVRIYRSFGDLFKARENLSSRFVLATLYVFIAMMQVLALYFTQSRGPVLGWMFSLFLMALVFSFLWQKRWLAYSLVTAAALGVGFLLVLNIEGGPLEGLRNSPSVGRFGQMLDPESRNAQVRRYIWEGVVDLVLPHEPLKYPDGATDRLNFLRPLIGYGPESMYVAYNSFYPPELTQVEKRNASPDRAHNETWDSLVITGVIGLGAFVFLFTSVFYYGLKWLGMIETDWHRRLFLALFLGLGAVSAAIFVVAGGPGYFGVGLPFGMLIGLVIYIVHAALFVHPPVIRNEGQKLRVLTLTGLLAVVGAHFVEINFGIGIVSTRTYLFVAIALLALVGTILPRYGAYGGTPVGIEGGAERTWIEEAASVNQAARPEDVKKRRKAAGRPVPRSEGMPFPAVWREALAGAFILSLILVTLGYNLISTASGAKSLGAILWDSLTVLPQANHDTTFSVLLLAVVVWLASAFVLASEDNLAGSPEVWLKAVGVILGVSLLAALVYWTWQAGSLARIVGNAPTNLDEVAAHLGRYEALLTGYYFILVLVVLTGASLLPAAWPVQNTRQGGLSLALTPLAFLSAFVILISTNMRVIQADMAFKLGDPYASAGEWGATMMIYRRAIQLAPREDHYYLFLGRANLEYGKTLEGEEEKERVMTQAGAALKTAQELNPLNTDHTANLARLYNLWAEETADAGLRRERSETASAYFADAVTLSPTQARLWDEWALLRLNGLGDLQGALERLQHSLVLDPYYDWTYALLGDYYGRVAQKASPDGSQERRTALDRAAEAYRKALELAEDQTSIYSYALALAGVESQREEPGNAIAAYQQALAIAPQNPDGWKIQENIARLHADNGNLEEALAYATAALNAAPQDQKTRLEELVSQLGGQP